MLKKVLASLLVALVFVIASPIINAAPVSVKQLACTVEQTSAPPGVDLQLEQNQVVFDLKTTQAEQIITYKTDVAIKGEILARGVPPRVMDQPIKIDDEGTIRNKGKQTNYEKKGKLLLLRRYKHCELYPQLNMEYRS